MTNELMLVEDQGLIRVYQTARGEYVVDGRELWEGLDSKQEFANWVKNRLQECDVVEGEGFLINLSKTSKHGGRPAKEYLIKLDTAKEMAMLERNEIGKQYRRYFIEVEKKYQNAKGNLTNLSPQLQFLIKLELEQQRLNEEQKKMQYALEDVNSKVDSIKEVVSLNSDNWRRDAKSIISKIAIAQGGYDQIREVNNSIYEQLNKRMGVNIKQRQLNKRNRMLGEGVSMSDAQKVSVVDTIADDKKLVEGYLAIVKEMAIKYSADKRGN